MEEYTFYYVGSRWPAVAKSCLEHLLQQHRGIASKTWTTDH